VAAILDHLKTLQVFLHLSLARNVPEDPKFSCLKLTLHNLMRIKNEQGFFLLECLERVLIFFAGQGGRQDGIGKLFSRHPPAFIAHWENHSRNHQAWKRRVRVLEGLGQETFAARKVSEFSTTFLSCPFIVFCLTPCILAVKPL
jgi:hypothetical protein